MMSLTILITGSTDGIGLLTAQMLSSKGHAVLLHGRSAAKLEAAAAQIDGEVLTFKADLSSLAETRAMAAEVREKVDSIDVLINNAGIYKTSDPVLPDGQDVRFVVNAIAPYALTKAVLPIMSKEARILNLSSAAQAPVNFDALVGQARVGDMDAYAQSKRAITLWTAALAKEYPEGPTFISVNPGSLLASKMVKEGFGVAGNDLRIGADILCRLTLEAEFADASGKYWDNDSGRFGSVDMAQTDALMKHLNSMI